MALLTLTNRAQYTADGVLTIFPFPYKFFEATDLKVYVGTSLKLLTTDYTVQGIPPGSFAGGGNVVFNSAPTALSIITIVRSVPRKQPSDFQDYPNYAAAADTFEQELDRRAMCEQELADEISRILKIPETDPLGLDMTLPAQSERALKFGAYDADGKPIAAAGLASVPVTSWAATLLDDESAAAARQTLNLDALTLGILNWTSAEELGSALSIPSLGVPALAALNGTDVAMVDTGIFELRLYRWDGTTWAMVGSGLSLAGIGSPALAALNDTDVAFIDATLEELRVYRWGGASWSQIGAGLSIPGIASPALAALNDTDVAFIDSTLEELRVYRWGGASWSQVGAGLSIAGIGVPALTALNATDVAFTDSTHDELRLYRWNGSAWTMVGSGLSLGSFIAGALAALNATDVVFTPDLRVYRWTGSFWVAQGASRLIAGSGSHAVTALNGTDVAFADNSLNSLASYRFGFALATPHRP